MCDGGRAKRRKKKAHYCFAFACFLLLSQHCLREKCAGEHAGKMQIFIFFHFHCQSVVRRGRSIHLICNNLYSYAIDMMHPLINSSICDWNRSTIAAAAACRRFPFTGEQIALGSKITTWQVRVVHFTPVTWKKRRKVKINIFNRNRSTSCDWLRVGRRGEGWLWRKHNFFFFNKNNGG